MLLPKEAWGDSMTNKVYSWISGLGILLIVAVLCMVSVEGLAPPPWMLGVTRKLASPVVLLVYASSYVVCLFVEALIKRKRRGVREKGQL